MMTFEQRLQEHLNFTDGRTGEEMDAEIVRHVALRLLVAMTQTPLPPGVQIPILAAVLEAQNPEVYAPYHRGAVEMVNFISSLMNDSVSTTVEYILSLQEQRSADEWRAAIQSGFAHLPPRAAVNDDAPFMMTRGTA